jgi:hypothetical protein
LPLTTGLMRNSRIRLVALVIALAATACADDPAGVARPEMTPQLATVDAHAVSTGDDFTCALRAAVVACQGLNNYGQAPASKAAATGFFMEIAAGGLHACARRNDGVIECWGNNNFSQAPATRTAATGFYVSLTAGTNHTCALRNDGVIECWGQNSHGQAQSTYTPAVGTAFANVSARRNHTCARRSTDSAVQCWGENLDGQAPATKFSAASVFLDVAVGFNHTCALRFDQKVECWGNNFYGQAPALKTAAVGSFTRIASGDLHTCGLRTDGKIECWGVSSYGEAPALISAPSGVSFSTLSIGTYHSCGTWNQGVLQCWGRSVYGEAISDIPAIQSMLVAESANGSMYLFFTDAWGETEFTIKRRRRFPDRTYGEWLEILRAPPNSTSYHDLMITEGYDYQYAVRACNTLCTPWRMSSVVRARTNEAPAAATSVTASVANPSRIDVAWAHFGNETSFNVQRRIRTYAGYGPWMLIANPAANTSSYTDLDVTTGKGYTYRVQACNAQGCSAWTSSPQATNETVPEFPPEMDATAYDANWIQLIWYDINPNEQGFQVQRTTRVGTTWSAYTTILNPPASAYWYDDNTVSSGTTYRYRVRACNVAGCSAYYATRIVTTP